ncbi:MAG: tRNA pseudouridine(55) synthase TruB [Firmicutes bacterium]|nr:tRNA pseudouridine(55) synthase TruB [Bacillota bacterium]
MKDGILNINKPQEMTSFDVVAILRRKLGIKRIGHLGTLDPMAEGVLPIALGKAARIMEYLDSDTKEYIGEFLFGITSDTDDIWGKELKFGDKKEILRSDLEDAIKDFVGTIEQIPPKYSALKVDGKKLYEYARAGKEVDIKSRKINIESFDILDFGKRYVGEVDAEICYAVVRIVCSKGTYIRSLARDVGGALGTGGLMSALIRKRSGAFKIDDAVPLNEIREMEVSDIEKLIVNTEEAIPSFPRVYLGIWEERLFRNGVPLESNQWSKEDSKGVEQYDVDLQDIGGSIDAFRVFPLELPEEYARTYLVFGEKAFLGIGLESGGKLKAEKVLV